MSRKYDPRWDQDREKVRRQVLAGIKPATANLTAADMFVAPAPADHPCAAADLGLQALIDVFAKQMSILGQIDCKSFGNPEAYIRDVLRQFAPRDFIEQMMVAEVLVLYGRLLHLSQMATRSVLAPQAFELHAAADRLAVSLRGTLKNLADHRHPNPRLAIAQVFQTAPEKNAQSPSELGFNHEKTTLPPIQQGVALPAQIEPKTPTLPPEHRPQVPGRQEDISV